MPKTRITKDILISRLKSRFSNESGSLVELDDWKSVNDYLKYVRKTAIEYKIDDFEREALELYNDDNLIIEYYFRHYDYYYKIGYRPNVVANNKYSANGFSKYIDWCYKIGMTEKNQIRKRLEFFDPNYIQDNKGITLTKIMRKYRDLYK